MARDRLDVSDLDAGGDGISGNVVVFRPHSLAMLAKRARRLRFAMKKVVCGQIWIDLSQRLSVRYIRVLDVYEDGLIRAHECDEKGIPVSNRRPFMALKGRFDGGYRLFREAGKISP
jgi:hypothetical protein